MFRGMGISRIVWFQHSTIHSFFEAIFAFEHPNPLCLGGPAGPAFVQKHAWNQQTRKDALPFISLFYIYYHQPSPSSGIYRHVISIMKWIFHLHPHNSDTYDIQIYIIILYPNNSDIFRFEIHQNDPWDPPIETPRKLQPSHGQPCLDFRTLAFHLGVGKMPLSGACYHGYCTDNDKKFKEKTLIWYEHIQW